MRAVDHGLHLLVVVDVAALKGERRGVFGFVCRGLCLDGDDHLPPSPK